MLALAVAALVAGVAEAATPGGSDVSTGFLFRSLKNEGRELDYVVYVPRAYDPSRAWPLILFLHGSGESGTDGSRELAQGLPRELVWNPDLWPFIVIIPQKPSPDTEWEQYELELMTMLARARHDYNVDTARLVLTGLSQGGHGAWVLGARHPELWAAVVSVCGYATTHNNQAGVFSGTVAELARGLARLPIWAFHGEADDVVPVAETRAMIAELEKAGAKPRVTTYAGVGHGCWERAYGEPELPRWMLAQRRAPARP
jgi:predicted peptidase